MPKPKNPLPRDRNDLAGRRQRRYRERQRAGRRVYRIEADDAELAAVLEKLRFLSPLNADDDEAVQRAFDVMMRVILSRAGW